MSAVIALFLHTSAGAGDSAHKIPFFDEATKIPNKCSLLPLVKELDKSDLANLSPEEFGEKIGDQGMKQALQAHYLELCNAAENVDVKAQMQWGLIFSGLSSYNDLLPIPKDNVRAYMWFNIASIQNDRAKKMMWDELKK